MGEYIRKRKIVQKHSPRDDTDDRMSRQGGQNHCDKYVLMFKNIKQNVNMTREMEDTAIETTQNKTRREQMTTMKQRVSELSMGQYQAS